MIVKTEIDTNDIFYDMDEGELFTMFTEMEQFLNDVDFTERVFEYCLDEMIETEEYHGEYTKQLIEKMKEYIKLMEEK